MFGGLAKCLTRVIASLLPTEWGVRYITCLQRFCPPHLWQSTCDRNWRTSQRSFGLDLLNHLPETSPHSNNTGQLLVLILWAKYKYFYNLTIKLALSKAWLLFSFYPTGRCVWQKQRDRGTKRHNNWPAAC